MVCVNSCTLKPLFEREKYDLKLFIIIHFNCNIIYLFLQHTFLKYNSILLSFSN